MVSFGMHSQDLYYSLKFIQTANIENKFSKIYLILGYYAPYLDLSLQTTERKTYIGGAYYSLFLDSHHWKDPFQTKTWHWSILYPSCIKEYCEKCFISYLKNVNSYYNNFRCRFDKEQFNGRKWAELPEKERIIIAKNRVEQHSRFKKYKTTFLENTDLLNKFYIEMVQKGIDIKFIIAPFSKEYREQFDIELKNDFYEIMKKIKAENEVFDFFDSEVFQDADFLDSDHLNDEGAKKFTRMIMKL